MKILFVFVVVILFIVLHFTIPSFSSVVQCYDNYTHAKDDLAFKTRVQGYGDERICQIRFDDVSQLQSCVNDTYGKSPKNIQPYLVKIYNVILGLIRPNLRGIEEQKAIHNSDCDKYPDYTFQ